VQRRIALVVHRVHVGASGTPMSNLLLGVLEKAGISAPRSATAPAC